MSALPGTEPLVAPTLEGKLRAVRRRWVGLTVGVAVAQWIVGFVAVLVAVMVVDRWADLPRDVRLGIVAVTGAASIGWLWVRAGRAWWRQPGDEAVALLIERDQPGLRQRLISSVQLRGTAGKAELVRALLTETEAVLGPADVSSAVPGEPMIRWGGAAMGVLLVGGLVAVWAGPVGVTRALGSAAELPRRTQITLLIPTTMVARGDDVTLTAAASGTIPTVGELRVKVKEVPERLEMKATSRPGIFAGTVRDAQESFTYRVKLGDNVSEERRVTVADSPRLKTIEFEVTPPTYTGLPAMRKLPGDLTVLAGSVLKVNLRATNELASVGNELLLPGGSGVPLARQGKDGGSAAIPVGSEPFTVSVRLRSAEGISSREMPVYRVNVVPDRPPTIRITRPVRKEDVVTKNAGVTVAFEAGDDVGLTAVRMRFVTHGDDPAGAAGGEPMSVPVVTQATTAIRGQFVLEVGKMGLVEGQTLEWWLEAVDGNTVSGPGVATSEHFLCRIASEEDVRTALRQRLSATVGTLQDAQGAQESLSRDVGKMLLEGPGEKRENPASQP